MAFEVINWLFSECIVFLVVNETKKHPVGLTRSIIILTSFLSVSSGFTQRVHSIPPEVARGSYYVLLL